MIIRFKDQFDLNNFGSTREITKEGYLKGIAAVTCVGIQYYSGYEFGLDPESRVAVFRPPETVFHLDTQETAKLKPITMQHPDEDVNSENHRRLSVGSTGEKTGPIDDARLGINIIINESSIVDRITSQEIGELSLGYDSIIIPEEGIYNGESYSYRFDGPMIINHLAVLQKGDGRCGEAVKILDHGEDNMKKITAVKLLKDAGCPESKLALYMKDAKDDAEADMKEFTKIIGEVSVKDMDLSGVMPMLVKELLPTMEKMVKEKGFMSELAAAIAATMAGSTEEAPAEEGSMDQESEETVPPSEEEMPAADACGPKKVDSKDMDKKIKDAAHKRAGLISKAMPFMGKDSKVHDMSDREIIEASMKALGIEDCKGRSDDYLMGILDSITEDRAKAVKSLSGDIKNINSISRPISGLDAKSL